MLEFSFFYLKTNITLERWSISFNRIMENPTCITSTTSLLSKIEVSMNQSSAKSITFFCTVQYQNNFEIEGLGGLGWGVGVALYDLAFIKEGGPNWLVMWSFLYVHPSGSVQNHGNLKLSIHQQPILWRLDPKVIFPNGVHNV